MAERPAKGRVVVEGVGSEGRARIAGPLRRSGMFMATILRYVILTTYKLYVVLSKSQHAPSRPIQPCPSRIVDAAYALWRKDGDDGRHHPRRGAPRQDHDAQRLRALRRSRGDPCARVRDAGARPSSWRPWRSRPACWTPARACWPSPTSIPRDYELLFGYGYPRSRRARDVQAAEFADLRRPHPPGRRAASRDVRPTALAIRQPGPWRRRCSGWRRTGRVRGGPNCGRLASTPARCCLSSGHVAGKGRREAAEQTRQRGDVLVGPAVAEDARRHCASSVARASATRWRPALVSTT